MRVIRERQEEEIKRELIMVGDTVKLVDSPLDRLKKGAKGVVKEIIGDMVADPNVIMAVAFRCGGQSLTIHASANRFRFTKHPKDEPLPDAENTTPNLEDEV